MFRNGPLAGRFFDVALQHAPADTEGMNRRVFLPMLALAILAGCATPSAFHSDQAHPATTTGWVDTRLYFGLGAAGGNLGVSEDEWRAFLDAQVTPRFPDGLSVLDVYGQWQDAGESAPERLRSKMLVIDYPDTVDNRAKIEAIRSAWKARTGDKSVLRVTTPAQVSF